MKTFTLLSLWRIVVAAAISSVGLADASKPNIVLIYIDDLGYGDLGCYGSKDIPTPHIDRLAAEGVRFTASYIPNPPCCPSRCSLMMGQYAQRFGKYGMSRGLPIPEDRPTLAQVLADHGYATGQIGKWDIGSKQQGPLQVGFTEVAKVPPKKRYPHEKQQVSKYFCLNEEGDTVWLTDHDGDAMLDFINRHRADPFFLYWSPEAVHSSNKEVPDRLADRTTAIGKRRKLAGAIISVDDQVGKLLATLDKHDLRKRTLIIFSSDNGANGAEGGTSTPYTGGKGKGTQKEGWVRVPTIFSLPGIVPQGESHHGLIANFDFYPTITSLTCGTIPEHCDGVDLLPYLQGKHTGPARTHLFWLNNQPDDAVRRHLVAARWKHWRLYKKYEEDRWQLFDLQTDPQETQDVSAQHPDIVTQMAEAHARWRETLAPLAQVPDLPDNPVTKIPTGHGWVSANES